MTPVGTNIQSRLIPLCYHVYNKLSQKVGDIIQIYMTKLSRHTHAEAIRSLKLCGNFRHLSIKQFVSSFNCTFKYFRKQTIRSLSRLYDQKKCNILSLQRFIIALYILQDKMKNKMQNKTMEPTSMNLFILLQEKGGNKALQ